jgi:uncharacterized protein YuzE
MLKLEVRSGSAFITYREHDTFARNLFVGGEGSNVIVDLNQSGDVIGIEIVFVANSDDVERARAFAEERGLQFPRKIEVPSEPAL